MILLGSFMQLASALDRHMIIKDLLIKILQAQRPEIKE
jgi:hypothetical protein